MTEQRSVLDPHTHALVALAAAIAQGEETGVRERVDDAVDAGVDPLWVDELILQSVLMVGYPRALIAAGFWRKAQGAPAVNGTDDLDYGLHAAWTARGEETCRAIYGDNYSKLRKNVDGLHPALDAWMITEGYGRTLSRPGLELKLREFCIIVQTAVLDTPRQLHSHLRGALNAGASFDEVEAVLTIANKFVAHDHWTEVKDLWEQVQAAWNILS